MSPLYSNRLAQNQLRTELTKPNSSAVRVALRFTLDALIRQENKLISQVHHNYMREEQKQRTSINCGLRHARETPHFVPLPHWVYDKDIDGEAKKCARIQLDLQDLLQSTQVDKTLIRLVYAHGTLHKAIKSIGFDNLLLLPQTARKDKSEALRKVLTTALQK